MKSDKKNLVFGVIIGIVLAFFYFHFFAPRYEIEKNAGLSAIKIDKWTGESWRYADNSWKKIMNLDQDWEQVDNALRETLNIPFAQVDIDSALDRLRSTKPVFKDISDEELLERIKIVYSKQVLCNMYLSDFIKKDETQPKIDD
ncbi:MAG: hypothetical protein JW882_18685 [Deltaproteobacteria bacterium]|nr:hypothetical protein [Deltaproteobacteria bacterium]